jgi:hypothetical protein
MIMSKTYSSWPFYPDKLRSAMLTLKLNKCNGFVAVCCGTGVGRFDEMCIDGDGGDPTTGMLVHTWDCGGTNDHWKFDSQGVSSL